MSGGFVFFVSFYKHLLLNHRQANTALPMAATYSIRERTLAQNSLIVLLEGLVGKETTVELRNENSVTGTIENVDAFMNVTMSAAVFRDSDGRENKLDDFFVQGKNIRYVQIPDEVNIISTIKSSLRKYQNPRPTRKKISAEEMEKRREARERKFLAEERKKAKQEEKIKSAMEKEPEPTAENASGDGKDTKDQDQNILQSQNGEKDLTF